MEPVSTSTVDDKVRDGQDLQQQPCSLAQVDSGPQEALGVNHHHFAHGVIGGPDSNCARLLGRRCLEHFPAIEESVVKGVRLAIPCVPKDGHYLQVLVRTAVQFLNKVFFIPYLPKQKEKSIIIM